MPSTPPPDVPAILDTWESLTEAHGTNRRSLAAAEALRVSGGARDRLRELLALAGWPDAFASPFSLGCVLAAVSRLTPHADGRALRRATTGRWYVIRERAAS